MNVVLVSPRSRSAQFGEENLLHLSGVEQSVFQSIACSLYRMKYRGFLCSPKGHTKLDIT